MNDRVSVIMATYNCADTVEKAIDSILAQTYENWVMIICDDGSTDHTLEILNRYKVQYPDKFVIIRNETNQKLPYSLNHCLEYVETDLVARMDGDDWSTPDRFEKQVSFLKEHPEYDLVGTGVIVSDGQNELTKIKEEAEVALDINDALKVTLLKYSSLENVKNVAENELSMVYPNKDNTIMIDMSKDYFSHISEEENGESFLDKIKGIFN